MGPGPGPEPTPGAGRARSEALAPGRGPEPPLPVKVVSRFFAVKSLDPQRVSRDADQIATEIVTHLVGLVGADVEVKLEITADVPEGVPTTSSAP